MQDHIDPTNTNEKSSGVGAHATSTRGEKQVSNQKGLSNFVRWDREAQLDAFFAWLPKELHDAPGIDWSRLQPEIMDYCVRVIGSCQEASTLAIVATLQQDAVSLSSQLVTLKRVNVLLRSLRASGQMQSLSDLKRDQVWHELAAHQENTVGARGLLNGYYNVAQRYFPRYLLRLDQADRQRMQQYALPLPPVDLRERYLPNALLTAKQREKRKSMTDIRNRC